MINNLVLEDVCKLCALEKDFYLLDRICEDCWESMTTCKK
jgi:hypothetical protein